MEPLVWPPDWTMDCCLLLVDLLNGSVFVAGFCLADSQMITRLEGGEVDPDEEVDLLLLEPAFLVFIHILK